MTTHSEAHFARRLLATLKEHHPFLVVETVKGRRVPKAQSFTTIRRIATHEALFRQ